MKELEENKNERSSRRNFLKKVGLGVGAVSVAGLSGGSVLAGNGPRRKPFAALISNDGTVRQPGACGDTDPDRPVYRRANLGQGTAVDRVKLMKQAPVSHRAHFVCAATYV